MATALELPGLREASLEAEHWPFRVHVMRGLALMELSGVDEDNARDSFANTFKAFQDSFRRYAKIIRLYRDEIGTKVVFLNEWHANAHDAAGYLAHDFLMLIWRTADPASYLSCYVQQKPGTFNSVSAIKRRWAEVKKAAGEYPEFDHTFLATHIIDERKTVCGSLFAPASTPDSADNQQSDDSDCEQPLTIPKWSKGQRQLVYCDCVIAEWRQAAPNQFGILDAFQELNWPNEIDDPLPPKGDIEPATRIRETLRELNRKQRVLTFGANGKGTGITWAVR